MTEAAETGEPMTSGTEGLLRQPEKPRATFLELFFDLVFVLALAQLSQGLLQNLSWSGVFQTLVLLLALWAVWANTASSRKFARRGSPGLRSSLAPLVVVIGSPVLPALSQV